MIPDQDCGGCQGLGAHKRWCVTVVGKAASMLGPWGDQMEEWGDRIGGIPHSQDTANMLYWFATVMEVRANKARQMHQEDTPMDQCDCEEHL